MSNTVTRGVDGVNTAKHQHAVPDMHSSDASTAPVFVEKDVLARLKHYLPSQTPLKDFIHHNSLHAFQSLKFYDALFKAADIFGYQVTLQLSEFRQLFRIGRISSDVLDRVIIGKTGSSDLDSWRHKLLSREYDCSVTPRIGTLRAHWKSDYKIDLDSMVQPLLFRVLTSYLDQGIALWKFPARKDGFLSSLRHLEQNGFTSFFRTERPRRLIRDVDLRISDLLKIVVGSESCYQQYLFDQQFTHQGWSGIVSTVEDQPHTLLDARIISLHDLIMFELLLEIDALDLEFGPNWDPLCKKAKFLQSDLFADAGTNELHQVLAIWQDAFEWSYYDEVLTGISDRNQNSDQHPSGKSFQALFCIDERECSIRRHIESAAPDCETFGTPGFFTVEFYFKPEHGSFYDKLCPAPVTPKYLIREYDVREKRRPELLYTKTSHTFFAGALIALTLGFWSAVRLIQNLFLPAMSPAISNAFAHMFASSRLTIENKGPEDREGNLQVGFTVDEMAVRVESLLRSIGLIKGFAPIVYAIGHGSSSANNPHHGAHDCGACSGRPGSVNARVFSFMANHPKVRTLLRSKGIDIPDSTQFVGGLHDTAADQIAFYDDDVLSAENLARHKQHVVSFEKALDHNAKERSRRFASINTRMSLSSVREAIRKRSVSLFEPRPELGHGTNSLCIVGHRNLTKNLFLDRRAFLNSYDYRTDPDGRFLAGVMKPLGPVCGGISLEYYFSRVDNHKLGAGTKLPHNVAGLIGVTNSSDGDLRPGLPVQMIEVHDPVRLLIIVEHYPGVVLKTIQSTPDMYEWFINEWVHLVALDPESGKFWYFKEGGFTEYGPQVRKIPVVRDFGSLVESAVKMETNRIADATIENLPVHKLK